jgi:hypothetical protein
MKNSNNLVTHNSHLLYKFVTGQLFSPDTPVSSTNKKDCQDITEIVLKVTLSTITLTQHYILTIIKHGWV